MAVAENESIEAEGTAEKSGKGAKSGKTDKNAKPISKAEALDNAIKLIEKDFGKGAVMRLGENVDNMNVEALSTGILPLDLALGIGGVPKGRIVELFGPESSGKTTVALHMIAEAQKYGGYAAFIDAEHALDPIYAENLGVNIEELLVAQPDSGEQALDIAEKLIDSSALDIIVIDSVAALVPQAEIDGAMMDLQVGLHARMMSKAMRKLTGIVSKAKTVVVFINQIREKVGISYGNPEVTTGGRALKFYATVRIEVRRGDVIKAGSEMLGNRTKVKIVKNKVAPPFRTAEFDILYGEGVSRSNTIIDMAVAHDIVEKGGAWYSYNGTKLGQGKENAKAFLESHPDMFEEIEEKVRIKAEEQHKADDLARAERRKENKEKAIREKEKKEKNSADAKETKDETKATKSAAKTKKKEPPKVEEEIEDISIDIE